MPDERVCPCFFMGLTRSTHGRAEELAVDFADNGFYTLRGVRKAIRVNYSAVTLV